MISARMTWIFFVKQKSDMFQTFKDFHNYFQNHFHTSIGTIRYDNAPEICQGETKQFCTSHGILHQKTCPYTPQHNGIIERKHRHILKVSRALFFQSKVPLRFREECDMCAVHLINRMPLQVHQFVSPYEKLFQESPSLDHLKVFGCCVFYPLCNISN